MLLKQSDCKAATLQGTAVGPGVLGFRAAEAKNRKELEFLRGEIVTVRNDVYTSQSELAAVTKSESRAQGGARSRDSQSGRLGSDGAA